MSSVPNYLFNLQLYGFRYTMQRMTCYQFCSFSKLATHHTDGAQNEPMYYLIDTLISLHDKLYAVYRKTIILIYCFSLFTRKLGDNSECICLKALIRAMFKARLVKTYCVVVWREACASVSVALIKSQAF